MNIVHYYTKKLKSLHGDFASLSHSLSTSQFQTVVSWTQIQPYIHKNSKTETVKIRARDFSNRSFSVTSQFISQALENIACGFIRCECPWSGWNHGVGPPTALAKNLQRSTVTPASLGPCLFCLISTHPLASCMRPSRKVGGGHLPPLSAS